MPPVITSSSDLAPPYLTEILRQQGVLSGGEVTDLTCDCASPFMSEVCKLHLVYSADAPSNAPTRLFFKLQPDGGEERGKSEILFYQHVMQSDTPLPIPACYFAEVDPNSGALNLLLEDLTETYDTLENELPPTESQCYQIVDVLAGVHVHFWESPIMKQIASTPTESTIRESYDSMQKLFTEYIAYIGERLLPSRRAIYEQTLERWLPPKLARFADGKNLTLNHGDAHAWNFMYPRNENDRPFLLDWEAIRIEVPTFDLAYLMTPFWNRERRTLYEEKLVRHYHSRLVDLGISGYSWDDCWRDYKLAVIDMIFEPMWWWKYGPPATIWWYRIERIMMAFEDLGCGELLVDGG